MLAENSYHIEDRAISVSRSTRSKLHALNRDTRGRTHFNCYIIFCTINFKSGSLNKHARLKETEKYSENKSNSRKQLELCNEPIKSANGIK